ncbi:MAG TPA: FAD-dependent oxidoreductase [Frankiaceae bacterium]|nr:FAD-dependent oxidoreductase [Frankiaceae bacterium]
MSASVLREEHSPSDAPRMTRTRVVIAGLGDSGLLTAINLAKHAGRLEIVGISTKPELVSGQELGLRISRPERWARDYRVGFDRYRRLAGVRTVHGQLTGLDVEGSTVGVKLADGTQVAEPYDVLVISTGVTNGFWRQPHLQSSDEVAASIQATHDTLAKAARVAIVGGGAAAVSSAFNVATRWPEKKVELYFPHDRALVNHHPQVWGQVKRRLEAAGVGLHGGHRAVIPDGFACDAITSEPVEFSTGQAPAEADAVLWATGSVTPNSAWLPPELLNDDGFVTVTPTLQLPGHPHLFAIGDVAATDRLRSSARNFTHVLLTANILAELAGKPLKPFKAPRSRWGSVFGPQHNGLQVFARNGRTFREPRWFVERVQQPLIVERGIYKGMRRRTTT